MSPRPPLFAACLFVFAGFAAPEAEAQLLFGGSTHGSCGQGNRPCGPGGLANLLIPQGFLGADFRPACRRHDSCYLNHTTGRYECDRQFFADLNCACNDSLLPGLCRLQARLYYRAVRRSGEQYYSPFDLVLP